MIRQKGEGRRTHHQEANALSAEPSPSTAVPAREELADLGRRADDDGRTEETLLLDPVGVACVGRSDDERGADLKGRREVADA